MKFTIYAKPRTKKNSSRVVRRGRYTKVLPSEAYEEFEAEALPQIPRVNNPIDYLINLKIVTYIEADRKSDLVGYIQAVQDILVKAGFLVDDNRKIVYTTDGSHVEVDRLNPRVEIEVTKL